MTNDNDAPNLNGPESMPLREFIKDFPMMVSVYDGDTLVRSEEINYGNKDHRVWLGKVTYWAISNNYVVETSRP